MLQKNIGFTISKYYYLPLIETLLSVKDVYRCKHLYFLILDLENIALCVWWAKVIIVKMKCSGTLWKYALSNTVKYCKNCQVNVDIQKLKQKCGHTKVETEIVRVFDWFS